MQVSSETAGVLEVGVVIKGRPTVFIVDDDEHLCESFRWFLESAGLTVQTFISGAEFLAGCDASQPGCLLLDLRMHDMDGLELYRELRSRAYSLPVIMMTAYGDVPVAVSAMKSGMLDFLSKPVNEQVLLPRVREALRLDARQRREDQKHADTARRLATLTPRQTQVAYLVKDGLANKAIAVRLGISAKTVEVHRKHVMTKMGVHCTADLVRLLCTYCDAAPPRPPDSAARPGKSR